MGKRKMTIIVDDDVRVRSGYVRNGIEQLVGVTVISDDPVIEPVTLRFVVEVRYDTPPNSIGVWPDINGYCHELQYEAASRVFILANDVKITGEVVKNG